MRMRLLCEEDHGLGIDRAVPVKEVKRLDNAIWQAALQATKLGVDFDRLSSLLDDAMDEVLYQALEAMDEATHDTFVAAMEASGIDAREAFLAAWPSGKAV
jgi:hypothetical protein